MGKYNEFFKRNPVFSRSDFGSYFHEYELESTNTLDQALQYHLEKGNIRRIKRGLYYSVPSDQKHDNYAPDPYLVASRLADDAVLGYHTALEVHGQAHTTFSRYFYITEKARSIKPLQFRGSEFKPVAIPKPLREKDKQGFGIEPQDILRMPVAVTSIERTLVDVLNRPDLAGGWEEIWRSFEGVGFLESEQIIEYCDLLENATLVARVGFFLEDMQAELSIEDKALKALEDRKPGQPRYLDSSATSGELIHRWNLIVPQYVREHQWEASPPEFQESD